MKTPDLFENLDKEDVSFDENSSNESLYSKQISPAHIRKYGQYFTNYKIAEFMVSWCCNCARNMLDPAIGNSIFVNIAKKKYSHCSLHGYEIDDKILDFFGNPAKAKIKKEDYLLGDWNTKYDAIVCNPPYNRFQKINNRNEIIDNIKTHTGIKYSTYTNIYALFLIKSIYQMSSKGRLAYIVPSEFLNSNYGRPIKELMLQKKLLRAVINFNNDKDLFINATTTSCILLMDKQEKNKIDFYSLDSIDGLNGIFNNENYSKVSVLYEKISAVEKWRKYLKNEKSFDYSNLKNVSNFCRISRGIATGSNDFFCFNSAKIEKYNIPNECLKPCICHSSDVEDIVFTQQKFEMLAKLNKFVFILDIVEQKHEAIKAYLDYGIEQNIHKKYLLSHRKPWFTVEKKEIAPIWISSAYRGNIKFVRNISNTQNLTTFHSMFINKEYKDYTDIIFCYFLTPIAQKIIRENRKELGNGLEKFQPSDLNEAKMLDVTKISEIDKNIILKNYNMLIKSYNEECISDMEAVFKKYL